MYDATLSFQPTLSLEDEAFYPKPSEWPEPSTDLPAQKEEEPHRSGFTFDASQSPEKKEPRYERNLPVRSLEAYTARINQIPLLTEEEERDLAKRFYDHNDLEAARKLLLSHLRFVVRVARGYMGYGLPLPDLIQEGNIGLMKAIKRFDPNVGVRLVSFAIHWIKAEMHEFILKNWRIVKVATTKAQRKLFFKLKKETQHLTSLNEDTIHHIAAHLNVNPNEVRVMNERLTGRDASFHGSENEEGTHTKAPEWYLEDNRYDPARQIESKNWTENQEHDLQQAMQGLDARSQDILTKRWLNPEKSTLHELAEMYHISAERVRQIEKIAMEKLKKMLLQKKLHDSHA